MIDKKILFATITIVLISFPFFLFFSSGRGHSVFSVLGTVPRATSALFVRKGLAVLHASQRAAVHDRGMFLLFLVHGQSDPVQFDVDEVQTGVPRDAVRLFGPVEEPPVAGPAVEYPRHHRAPEHDDQHRGVPQVRGAQVDAQSAGRQPDGRRSIVAGRQSAAAPSPPRPRFAVVRRARRRAGHDLAGQRERAVLQDAATGHRGRFQGCCADGRRDRCDDGAQQNLRRLRNANRGKSALYRNRNLHLTVSREQYNNMRKTDDNVNYYNDIIIIVNMSKRAVFTYYYYVAGFVNSTSEL